MNRRFAPAALSVLGLMFALLLAPLTAHADGESNEVGACLSADKVWLLVVSDTSKVLANECVGTPANGEAALKDAGLKLGFDSSQFICSINGIPEQCPTSFTATTPFWNYYQGKPGAEYTFSQVGASQSKPTGGSIEAWCFSTPQSQTCIPPQLKIVQDGKEIAPPAGTKAEDLPVTNPSASATASPSASSSQAPAPDDKAGAQLPLWGWVLIAVGAVAVIAAVTAVIVSRQRSAARQTGTLGGR